MARRVFFSFHYADVASFRANVVRNCSALNNADVEFFDASLWEESKRKGATELQRLIDKGLDRTTVTAVLIGAKTALRPWVRYEIAKSFERDNGLLGIYIHTIPDKTGRVGPSGPNPFEYLAYRFDAARQRVELFEWNGAAWVQYAPLPSFPTNGRGRKLPSTTGGPQQLSTLLATYTWDTARSPREFPAWVETAALEAGR